MTVFTSKNLLPVFSVPSQEIISYIKMCCKLDSMDKQPLTWDVECESLSVKGALVGTFCKPNTISVSFIFE